MAKRGRPAFKATATLRREVEELVACGMAEDSVARAIGCSTPTLQKHFADELATGHAKQRAAVIRMLFKTARKGNVSAQRKLEEMTGVAAAAADFERAAEKPRRIGKKEEATEAAATAGEGTDWGDDLRPPTTPLN